MSTPQHTTLQSNKTVCIIGDHYDVWMGFERKRESDNDPEHQPINAPKGRQPKYYYSPGGAGYVKRLMDCILGVNDPNKAVTVVTYPDKGIQEHTEPFTLGASTASFTLDHYPKYPDSRPVEDKVYRIKSHYGYYPALKALQQEQKLVNERRTVLQDARNSGRSEADISEELAQLKHRETELEERRKFHYLQNKAALESLRRSVATLNNLRLLVVEDMDMGFRDEEATAWQDIIGALPSSSPKTNIIVLLGRTLPKWSVENEVPGKRDGNRLWDKLRYSHAKQSTIIVNADLLRFTGAHVSRRVSWERTAQDCLEALRDTSNKKLAPFQEFAHVIIRFGVVGAIHCYSEGNRHHADLYYDTKAHDGVFRDVEEEGGVVGNNSVFAAYIAEQLIYIENSTSDTEREAISRAIAMALPGCQRLFRYGYGPRFTQPELDDPLQWKWPPSDLFREDSYDPQKHKGYKPTHSKLIHKVKAIPAKNDDKPWSIIASVVVPERERLELAFMIAKCGLSRVLNNPLLKDAAKIFSPIATFGSLDTIDRDEIESFRGVSNIIRQYLRTISKEHLAGPMSIAVFGPPGSGKSYTVREIVKNIDPSIERNFLEINLAQLTSPKELSSYLLRVNDLLSAEKTPLVFFDEFDCRLGNDELGWLKYFLAPMESGTFEHPEEGVFRLGRGIFVFAGGTRDTYAEFLAENFYDKKAGGSKRQAKGRSREPESSKRAESETFKKCKGPDFISRLRGHIDVKGINSVKRKDRQTDDLFMLRRAIILRSLLERHGLVSEIEGIAQVDGSLLKGILAINSAKDGKGFNYDTRSMRTVINMCLRLHGRIEKACLPPPALLDMHVDHELLAQEMAQYPDESAVSDDNAALS